MLLIWTLSRLLAVSQTERLREIRFGGEFSDNPPHYPCSGHVGHKLKFDAEKNSIDCTGKNFNDGSSITVLANGNVVRTGGGEEVLTMTLEATVSKSFKRYTRSYSLAKATRNDVRSNFVGGSQTPRGSGVHQKLPPGWKLEGKLHSTISQEEQARPRQSKAKQGKEARCTPLFIYSQVAEAKDGCNGSRGKVSLEVHFLKIIKQIGPR